MGIGLSEPPVPQSARFLLELQHAGGKCRGFLPVSCSPSGYLLLAGLVSFGVCYRYGPLENKRSINLLSWALQLLGLLFMYSSIQIHPIALALVLVAICTKSLDYPLQWGFALYR